MKHTECETLLGYDKQFRSEGVNPFGSGNTIFQKYLEGRIHEVCGTYEK